MLNERWTHFDWELECRDASGTAHGKFCSELSRVLHAVTNVQPFVIHVTAGDFAAGIRRRP
jgi:hypothetical protein